MVPSPEPDDSAAGRGGRISLLFGMRKAAVLVLARSFSNPSPPAGPTATEAISAPDTHYSLAGEEGIGMIPLKAPATTRLVLLAEYKVNPNVNKHDVTTPFFYFKKSMVSGKEMRYLFREVVDETARAVLKLH